MPRPRPHRSASEGDIARSATWELATWEVALRSWEVALRGWEIALRGSLAERWGRGK